MVLKKEGIFLTDVMGQASDGSNGNRAQLKGAGEGRGRRAEERRQLQAVHARRGQHRRRSGMIMTRQLATLLGAGVTLVEALSALVDQGGKRAAEDCLV